MFFGPHKYTTVDGTFNEHIVLTYETHHISGVPLGRLNVSYQGDNARFHDRQNLTLALVKPMLREWGY
jgi:hypothetical protein